VCILWEVHRSVLIYTSAIETRTCTAEAAAAGKHTCHKATKLSFVQQLSRQVDQHCESLCKVKVMIEEYANDSQRMV
jgi:hypothetical protein